MKTTNKVVALVGPCLLAFGSAAHAAPADEMKPYVEASYAWPKLESSGISATSGAAVLRAGINFNQYWALDRRGLPVPLIQTTSLDLTTTNQFGG